MPFYEDNHVTGGNMVEAYGVCDILLYIYAHMLVLISHNMRCLYTKKTCNIPTANSLTIIDEDAVKEYCFVVIMYQRFKISVLCQSQIEKPIWLLKATVSFVMPVSQSVRPSVRLSAWNNSAPIGQIFMKFDIRIFFKNLSRKFKFHSIRTNVTGTLHEDQYAFLIICRSVLLRRKNYSDKVVEKIKTHISCSTTFLSKIVPFMR